MRHTHTTYLKGESVLILHIKVYQQVLGIANAYVKKLLKKKTFVAPDRKS